MKTENENNTYKKLNFINDEIANIESIQSLKGMELKNMSVSEIEKCFVYPSVISMIPELARCVKKIAYELNDKEAICLRYLMKLSDLSDYFNKF